MSDSLKHYAKRLRHLHTDSGHSKYPVATRHRAPHKPILLLSILDLFEQGQLSTNFVPLGAKVGELFTTYWELLMPTQRVGHLYMPFYHMKNDGFWHLIPHPNKADTLAAIQQIAGAKQLREIVSGGQFDPELFILALNKDTRNVLREAIIDQYFQEDIQALVWEQAHLNSEAYEYSLTLLDNARAGRAAAKENQDGAMRPARDQGFRKAIIRAYDHRCVLCGVRLVTDDGLSAAVAAHIIPWHMTHNDDPRNGLCLCHLCHWAFDVGMVGISTQYRIRLSSQVTNNSNRPGHLSTLEDRPIFEPLEDAFDPDKESLKWHLQKIFLA